MNDKTERLSALIKELRGSLNKTQFAKRIGVERSSISVWELGRSYPESENMRKIARLKGWSLEQLEAYLLKGELPTEDPLEQILREIRSMPSESVAQIAAVAGATLAERMGYLKEKVSV